MSVENVKKFYMILQKDKILQCKLKNLELSKIIVLDSSKKIELEPIIEKIIPIAKEYGCDFSVKDFKEFREDLILKHITGGFIGVCIILGNGLSKNKRGYKIRSSRGGGFLACLTLGFGTGVVELTYKLSKEDKEDKDYSEPFEYCLGIGVSRFLKDSIADFSESLGINKNNK